MPFESPTPRINMVRIQLESQPTVGLGTIQCDLANRMLEKMLGEDAVNYSQRFFVHDKNYCFGCEIAWEVLDKGSKWFNLDYMGRAAPQAPVFSNKVGNIPA